LQADLGQELVEAWIGAQGVCHGFDLQVDEAVDALLIGGVEILESLVFVAQADIMEAGPADGRPSGKRVLTPQRRWAYERTY